MKGATIAMVAVSACLLAACQPEPKAAVAPGAAQPRAQRTGPDVAALTGYGKYDEAAQLGEELLAGNPNDAKTLADMAALSLARIRTEPEQRAQHVAAAEHYAERLAQAHGDDPAKLLVAAGIYQRAAGMSREAPCPHYARAYQLLQKRGELLEAARGRQDAVKRQNQKDVEELRAILERGRCGY